MEELKNQTTAVLLNKDAFGVKIVADTNLPTEIGEFRLAGYRSEKSNEEFIVLYKGDLGENIPALVRIHSQCLTGDVFGSIKCDCGGQLRRAMELIEEEGRGAIVYQQQEGRGIGIINKIRAYALQDEGADTIEANRRLGFQADLRRYHECVAILPDLRLQRIKIMSNNLEKIRAIRAGGLENVRRVPLEVEPSAKSLRYLLTKKTRMGHLLELVG